MANVDRMLEYECEICMLLRKSNGVPTDEVLRKYSEMYAHAHELALDDYADDGHSWQYYKNIANDVRCCEIHLRYDKNYIISSHAHCDFNAKLTDVNGTLKNPNEDKLIRAIVNEARKRYLQHHSLSAKNINDIKFLGKCYNFSKLIYNICSTIPNVHSELVCVKIGYCDDTRKTSNLEFWHCFDIVTIGTKKYIVDLSYKQFFLQRFNFSERMSIPMLLGTHPGYFMCTSEKRKKVAQNLIDNGYVPYTPENLKDIFDGYTLMFRNGNWYDNQGFTPQMPNSLLFTVPYSAKDYQSMLENPNDDLFQREDPNNENLIGPIRKRIPHFLIKSHI